MNIKDLILFQRYHLLPTFSNTCHNSLLLFNWVTLWLLAIRRIYLFASYMGFLEWPTYLWAKWFIFDFVLVGRSYTRTGLAVQLMTWNSHNNESLPAKYPVPSETCKLLHVAPTKVGYVSKCRYTATILVFLGKTANPLPLHRLKCLKKAIKKHYFMIYVMMHSDMLIVV